jgi:hypothetical protein
MTFLPSLTDLIAKDTGSPKGLFWDLESAVETALSPVPALISVPLTILRPELAYRGLSYPIIEHSLGEPAIAV